MAQTVELPISGQATASVKVNLRQGAPSIQSPVVRKLSAGMTIPVLSVVVGDTVQGNAHWYRSSDNTFAWAGAFLPIESVDVGAPPVPVQSAAADSGFNLTRVPLVVDIFHGDSVASFDEAFAAGLRAVIHKATTGATGRDDAYANRRILATRAGLLWGAFHWGTAAPISNQVDNFLTAADPDEDTLVALDFERDVDNQMTLQGAREFLGMISDKLHRKAVLYSGDTAKSALGTRIDPFFGSHRLWLAQYGNHPSVQGSWQNFWLWQYTDGTLGPGRKTVPGIPGDRSNRLDCDYFAGTEADLKAQWAS
ncbi:MAG TPA: GH25 family lysozyme [Bradyrhizobium sp.]|jgi:GH25 family lysozyme M1 (1,4-beta-N-acetylmuramidase)|nr:GH25 family lysozyme [Bradyrhizobium sp.]